MAKKDNVVYKIYKITNILNGKCYIGQTKQDLKDRWRDHCKPSNTQCFLLKRALNKYGKNSFCIDIIDFCNNSYEADERERYWIFFYESSDPKHGYNYLDGGRGWNGIHSEESLEKMRIASTGPNNANWGIPKSSEWKNNMSKKMTGRKQSEETKKKLSEYFTGPNNPNWGIPKSDEWKANSSISQKNRTGNTGAAIKIPIIELTSGLFFDSITDAADAFCLNKKRICRQLKASSSNCHGKIFAIVK